VSSASAEIFADIALCPFEMTKVKMQVGRGKKINNLILLFFMRLCVTSRLILLFFIHQSGRSSDLHRVSSIDGGRAPTSPGTVGCQDWGEAINQREGIARRDEGHVTMMNHMAPQSSKTKGDKQPVSTRSSSPASDAERINETKKPFFSSPESLRRMKCGARRRKPPSGRKRKRRASHSARVSGASGSGQIRGPGMPASSGAFPELSPEAEGAILSRRMRDHHRRICRVHSMHAGGDDGLGDLGDLDGPDGLDDIDFSVGDSLLEGTLKKELNGKKKWEKVDLTTVLANTQDCGLGEGAIFLFGGPGLDLRRSGALSPGGPTGRSEIF
jgi:hypothetical protein